MARILVVEDDPEMNNYIALTLRLEGHEVAQAHDGKRGVVLAHEFKPDLILTDIQMPFQSGIDLARELAESSNTVTIPIIFVTGQNDLHARLRGLEFGIDYIVKPFATPELSARVRAAMRLRTLERELRAANEELLRVNVQLELLALTDELTNICNRRGFSKYLEDELRRTKRFGTPVALVIFDLDHFKNINDTWGHAQGDMLLQEFSQLLREASRHIDVVSRYGGEEFAVVLPSTDEKGALIFAEKARAAVEGKAFRRVTGDAESLPPLAITASGGGAVLSEIKGDDEISEVALALIRAADTRLYRAKESGRNRVIVEAVRETDIMQASSTEQKLPDHDYENSLDDR